MLWAVLLAAAGYLVWRASRSPLRPHLIPFQAWGFLVRAVKGQPWAVLGIALVIASGMGLQVFFVRSHIAGGLALSIASLGWQAVMATAAAALVTRVHRFVIFAHAKETIEAPNPRSRWGLALVAGAYGLAIWMVTYLIGLASRVGVLVAPPPLRVVMLLIEQGLPFLLLTPLALVRPLLALGRRRPVADALRLARRNLLPLYVTSGLLLVAPALAIPACTVLPQIMMGPEMHAQPVSAGLVTLFTIVQFLAVEIAAVIFARRAVGLETQVAAEPGVAAKADASRPLRIPGLSGRALKLGPVYRRRAARWGDRNG